MPTESSGWAKFRGQRGAVNKADDRGAKSVRQMILDPGVTAEGRVRWGSDVAERLAMVGERQRLPRTATEIQN